MDLRCMFKNISLIFRNLLNAAKTFNVKNFPYLNSVSHNRLKKKYNYMISKRSRILK